jgi:hypothetical protein
LLLIQVNQYAQEGNGQDVKNQNIESPKRTSKVQKEHQKSERQKSNLSDFQILMKCQLPMA